VLLLADARYRCTSCGDCCRGWDVPLTEGEAESFAKLIPAARLARVGEFEVIQARGGQCAALAEDQRCTIHGQHPRACRIFPFTFVETPTEVRVGLSFACPAVVDAEGPLLADQQAEIEALWAASVKGTRFAMRAPDPTPLDDDVRLPWSQAQVLLDEIAGAVDGDGPLVKRICRAGALLACTLDSLAEKTVFADAMEIARESAEKLVYEALADPPAVDRLSRAMFRTLLGATEPAAGVGRRIGNLLSGLLGRGGSVRLRTAREVSYAEVERVRAGLDEAGEELLGRWLVVSLEGLTFFGDAAFGLSVAGGLDLLVLSAAVTVFLARAYAAAAGRGAATLEDCKQALRQLDAGLTHRAQMPGALHKALRRTASLDLLREQLTASGGA
jgi:Fe-S-cluster containining protein